MEKAVVIGGSSGIGKATCIALREMGYEVFNASRGKCDEAGITDLTLDVSKDGEIERVLGQLEDIAVLVYSAGFSMAAPIEHVDMADVRYLYEVNFFGLLRAIKCCVKGMRERGGGRIIAVGSLGSVIPIVFDSFYSSSKAALDMLVRAANIELNPYGIFLTSVRPGGTDTRFTFKRKVYPESEVGVYGEKLNKATVTLSDVEQRGMAPSDVASCIVSTLCRQRPPLEIDVGISNKSIAFMKKLFPTSFVDFLDKTFYLQ